MRFAIAECIAAEGASLSRRTGFRVQAYEIAIGMTMPYAAIELMKLRLARSAFQRVNFTAP